MPDSPSGPVPGESMSTVTPFGVRMRVQSTGMRTVPGLDRGDAVLAVDVRAALDQEDAAVVAEDVALHLAADEARTRR